MGPIPNGIFTISRYEPSGRTIITYMNGDEKVKESYMGISVDTALRKFRAAHGLKGLRIPKMVFNHNDY